MLTRFKNKNVEIIMSNGEEYIGPSSPWVHRVLPLLNERKTKAEKIINEYNEIKSELDSLNQEYEELSNRYNMLSKPLKDNFIQRFIKKITGQYEKNQLDINNAYDEMKKIREKINEKEKTLNSIQVEKENAEKDLKELNNPQNYSKENVQKLIDENPDLKKDPEFMTALVMSYPQAIALDESNDKRVYNQFFREYVRQLEGFAQEALYGSQPPDVVRYHEIEDAIQLVERIVEEINRPKKAGEDKYKIPQKYLFKLIRKATLENDRIYPERMFNKTSYGVGTISSYLEMDCNIPQDYGTQMEKIISNDEVYVLRHKMYNAGTNEETIENVMRDGLHDSSQGGRNMRIDNTFSANIPGGHPLNLLGLLEYNHSQIIYAIPKQIIDDPNSLIWKSNEEDGEKYLDPQFLVGYVKKGEPKFYENPVPVSERTQYSKGFTDAMIKENVQIEKIKYTDIQEER